MEYRLEVAPRALREIEQVYDSIAQQSRLQAERWRQGLRQKMDSLCFLPERYELAPESESAGFEIRQLLYGKRRNVYRVLYTVSAEVVRVIRSGTPPVVRWNSERRPSYDAPSAPFSRAICSAIGRGAAGVFCLCLLSTFSHTATGPGSDQGLEVRAYGPTCTRTGGTRFRELCH